MTFNPLPSYHRSIQVENEFYQNFQLLFFLESLLRSPGNLFDLCYKLFIWCSLSLIETLFLSTFVFPIIVNGLLEILFRISSNRFHASLFNQVLLYIFTELNLAHHLILTITSVSFPFFILLYHLLILCCQIYNIYPR